MMKKEFSCFVLGFALLVFFLSCGRKIGPDSRAQNKAAGGAGETVNLDNGFPGDSYSIEAQTNGELLRIAENARETLPDFFLHLFRAARGEANFCVKYPFRTDSGSGFSMEQLWLSELRFKNGVYYGVLINSPLHIAGMKKGSVVTFSADEITDWMYTRNGKIVGGRSIKYLLEQIPQTRRSTEQRAILTMFE
ncbi:MAG: DUF2314 domain-containing protein [Treponema sp.]|jgi:uncharacterized protein YegJ (DUF2314 family)|nr:DUF2314 domain-containing protein [Treponema sp.]